ncbi:ABC transporter permease [Patescibacteria group bacterium]|nr:ABC transporter permease [Patescibacteria group bacterium]MBU4580337.1 ABC transporter permease [Patescibacteria group bacterium]
MNLYQAFKTALMGLKANASRSILTILGIVIGIAAIIVVVAIGDSAQAMILGQIGGLGSKTINIEPGREPQGPSDMMEALYSDSLKERDVVALKNKANVPGLKDLTPNVIVPGSVSYQGETFRSMNFGSSSFLARVLDIHPIEGVFFGDEEIKQRASVAVIGSKVKEKLFGLSTAIGENIKIKNKNFRVIGVLPQKGQVSIINVDNVVIIPYSTAQKNLLGINYYHSIMTEAESEEIIAKTANDIKLTLRELHGITDPKKDDFRVMTQADMADRAKTITGVLTWLLVSVAAISLVVGGIGIMNIMFVSVTERTREIGLRKALGATDNNILTQFLLEAVLLTAAGGAIGILLGAGISYVATIILSQVVAMSWTFTFPVSAALIGIAVSTLVGLVFGLYPAYKAAHKNPIEALRYE